MNVYQKTEIIHRNDYQEIQPENMQLDSNCSLTNAYADFTFCLGAIHQKQTDYEESSNL